MGALAVGALVVAGACGADDPGRATPGGLRLVEVAETVGIDVPHGTLGEPPACLLSPEVVGDRFPDLPASAPNAEQPCTPERMSGGAAVADYERNGHLDLYVSRLDGPGVLYRNNGDGTFTDVTVDAGLGVVDAATNGAAFADLTNDGYPDLYVSTIGHDRFYLFVNQGDGTFSEEAVIRGAALERPYPSAGFSVAVGDFDNDGWLDLHTTEWRYPDLAPNESPSRARLLRNLGAEGRPGHFEDVTEAAGVALEHPAVPVWAFASAFVDLDGDGWSDLVVVSDFGTSRLFRNQGDGTFRDGTAEAGVGTDENGMGSTVIDLDGDGSPDWFVTSIYDDRDAELPEGGYPFGRTGNRLFRNDGDGTFTDATDRYGVRDGGWGWGAAFADLTNDGHPDLVMTNGVDFPDTFGAERWLRAPKRLWFNDGAPPFEDVALAAGFDDDDPGAGLLVADFAGDGQLDVLAVQIGGRPLLYRNETPDPGRWLRVLAPGTDSNRDGLGAVVTIRATPTSPVQTRAVGSVSHFLGQSDRGAHFGLGDHEGPVHEVRVRWPATGRERVVREVATDRELVVVEPAAPGAPGEGREPDTTLTRREPPR